MSDPKIKSAGDLRKALSAYTTATLKFIRAHQKILVMILAVLSLLISVIPLVGIVWCISAFLAALVVKLKPARILSLIGLIISIISSIVFYTILLPNAEDKVDFSKQINSYKQVGLALCIFQSEHDGMPSKPGFAGLNDLVNNENSIMPPLSPSVYRVDASAEKAQTESEVILAYLGNGISKDFLTSKDIDFPVCIEKPWLSKGGYFIIYSTGWVNPFKQAPGATCVEVIDSLKQEDTKNLPAEIWEVLRRNAAEIDRISGKSR